MSTKTKDTARQVIAIKKAFIALHTLGYKILLRDYGCALGNVDLIAKQGGEFVFIGINNVPSVAVARFYMNRYGIEDVKYRLESFDVK